ncbi:MAG TPA: chemotaxis response regulator protein-glutamate methylesterase [Edaphobacter sp.]
MRALMGRPLRILAADDSAVMRGIMRNLFAAHAEDRSSELPRMELCGVARDGVECLEAVGQLAPDVLVLDLEMPRLNGLDVLERLRRESPALPVIMCSAHTEHGARSTLEALARGASDYVMKPAAQRNFAEALQSLSMQLLPKIVVLAKGAARRRQETGDQTRSFHRSSSGGQDGASVEVIVIGLSTGGPSALEHLLPKLPKDFAVPILIVQHMPKLFTGALAERLNHCCALHVEEAYDGAVIRPGTVWLAPGDAHMEVATRRTMLGDREGVRLNTVRLHQREPLNHCRPSVDYLFHSAARVYGAGALALMMTGMGSDGLEGARAIHQRGGMVLAQDEATSAVWGMPGRVSEAGIASATLPLWALAGELEQRVSAGRGMRPEAGLPASDALSVRREVMHGLY